METDSQVIEFFLTWAEKSNTKNEIQFIDGSNDNLNLKILKKKVLWFAKSLCRVHKRRTPSHAAKSGRVEGCANHYYLYLALRLCYKSSVKSGFSTKERCQANQILREICLCEGSLSSVFSVLRSSDAECRVGLGSDLDPNFYTLYESNSHKENIRTFGFYLDCMLPLGKDPRDGTGDGSRGYCVQDIIHQPMDALGTTPLMAAVITKEAEFVLMLLRYGADPLRLSGLQSFLPETPVEYIAAELNIAAMARKGSWISTVNDAQSQNQLRDVILKAKERGKKDIQCLRLLAKAVPTLNIRKSVGFFNHLEACSDLACNSLEEKVRKDHIFILHPGVSSVMDFDAFCQPPSLSHACRCRVRRTLLQAGNINLPAAISCLPLPNVLLRFLDLCD